MSTFSVVCRLRTLAGDDLFDLHDHANGYEVLAPIAMPSETWRRDGAVSRYVDGSYEGSAVLDSGELEVMVKVSGSSWVQVETRRLAARAAWMAHPSFLVDVTLEGVTHTFRANRPDVVSLDVDPNDFVRKARTFRLVFPVQPNPIVTGV